LKLNFEEAHNQNTMTSQEFLILIGAIAGILLFAFSFGKKGFIKPSKLNLRHGNGAMPEFTSKNRRQIVPITRSRQSLEAQGFSGNSETSRNLNVVFNYNGHTFDAYEVFGLPAGAGIAEVTKAFNDAIKESDPQSAEFLNVAYQAIRQNLRTQ
jgi:hypothetical protein